MMVIKTDQTERNGNEMITIKDFRYYFYYDVQERGGELFRRGCVQAYEINGKTVTFTVQGKRKKPFTVAVDITPQGVLTAMSCDCPASKKGKNCEHEFASLLVLKDIYEEEISEQSSAGLVTLIRSYQKQAIAESNETAVLETEWHLDDGLNYRLKIGNEKMYLVKNIDRLIRDFKEHATRQYGKFFTFTHHFQNLDEL